jgi:hypothetical protein
MGKEGLMSLSLPDKLALETGRAQRALDMTTNMAKVWAELCKQKKFTNYLDPFEQIILVFAKTEWGHETQILCDRDEIKITVKNPRTMQRKVLLKKEYEVESVPVLQKQECGSGRILPRRLDEQAAPKSVL